MKAKQQDWILGCHWRREKEWEDLPKLYIISYLILPHIVEVMTGQNICFQNKWEDFHY